MTPDRRYVVLRSASTTVVLTDDDAVPVVVHWGARLPDSSDPGAFDALTDLPLANGSIDELAPLSLLPERSRGWSAGGGLETHRPDGTAWAARVTRTSSEHDVSSFTWTGTDGGAAVVVTVRAALD